MSSSSSSSTSASTSQSSSLKRKQAAAPSEESSVDSPSSSSGSLSSTSFSVSERSSSTPASASVIQYKTDDDLLMDHELQQIRNESHPVFLQRIALLEATQKEKLAAIERLRQERKSHIEMIYKSEIKQWKQEFADARTNLKETLIDEAITKLNESKGIVRKVSEIVTRKRAKITAGGSSSSAAASAFFSSSSSLSSSTPDEANGSPGSGSNAPVSSGTKSKSKFNTRGGSKYSLSAEEIQSDLGQLRSALGITGSTLRSSQRAKGQPSLL